MKYITGNLLDAKTEALVNTVNTVGVMGKGIALQFKDRFPMNFKAYAAACKRGDIETGKMFVVKEITIQGEKIIINFPTKTEWFRKSQYTFIEEGLKDLVRVIKEYNIRSIAVPPLGCGNGGLKWEKVMPLMEKYLGPLSDLDIYIFQPNNEIKAVLQAEAVKKEIKLTPARAMLLYSLFKYERYGEVASVFAANKLAYFLQQSGEPLNLKFVPYTYGPYSNQVEKVLLHLNGKYLKGLEQNEAKPFEPLQLNYDLYPEVEAYIHKQLNAEQCRRLDNLFSIIDGFESTLSLEILASIDYLLAQDRGQTTDQLLEKIRSWNSRKRDLIHKGYVEIAREHLQDYGSSLHFN